MRISQQQILEMECRLLFSKFKSEATISRVQEKIAVSTGEDSVHRAIAFKLGLQAALDSKKPCPQTGATNGAAPRHNLMQEKGWKHCPGEPPRPATQFAC